MPLTRKSTARVWAQAKTPGTKYRDRGTARLPGGTSKAVVGYGPTKALASADLDRKLEALERLPPETLGVLVRELFAEFVQHKRSVRGRKEKTIFDDMGLYERHVGPKIGAKLLGEVTLADLHRLQIGLTAAGKYRTAELVTILVKSLFKYAAKLYRAEVRAGALTLPELDDLDQVKRPPFAKRKPGELWTLEQVGAFLDLAERRYRATSRSLVYPLFYTAITAGLRRGELLGLKRGALQYRQGRPGLDITEQFVYYGGEMHHDTPKTEAGVRWLPITPGLEAALKEHVCKVDAVREANPRWEEHGLMFPSYEGTPAGPRNIYRTRDELVRELGLPHSTLHQMRKVATSYLTRDLIRQGRYSPKLVQRFLGHTRPNVAMDVYTLVVEDDYLLASFDPRAGGADMKTDTPDEGVSKSENEEL